MTEKKSKPVVSAPTVPAVWRWRVVWAIGATNGMDFIDAIDAEAAGLECCRLHPGCVITYTAIDTRDP